MSEEEIKDLKSNKDIQIVWGGRRYNTEGMILERYVSKDRIRELVHEMNKFEDEFISKEKVKDKIKEVESYLDNAKENSSIKEYELVIEFLEELLED